MTKKSISDILSQIQVGQYSGTGHWDDISPAQEDYPVKLQLEYLAGKLVLKNERVFKTYTEDSTIVLTPDDGPFFDVVVTAGAHELKGRGYGYSNAFHLGFKLNEDFVESTYIFSDRSLRIIGSSTNGGKFTSWSEELKR